MGTSPAQKPKPIKKPLLSAHHIELGGHADLHLERTLGLSLNGYINRAFSPKNSILDKNTTREREGDFYLGTTYRLKRI